MLIDIYFIIIIALFLENCMLIQLKESIRYDTEIQKWIESNSFFPFICCWIVGWDTLHPTYSRLYPLIPGFWMHQNSSGAALLVLFALDEATGTKICPPSIEVFFLKSVSRSKEFFLLLLRCRYSCSLTSRLSLNYDWSKIKRKSI